MSLGVVATKRIPYFAMLGLTIVSGLAGYVSNVLIANVWGAITYGHILAYIATISLLTIPATLITLPLSKWAGETEGRRSVDLRVLLAAVGVAAFVEVVGLGMTRADLHLLPPGSPGWTTPLMIWIPSVYLNSTMTGLALGRANYRGIQVLGAAPALFRLLLLVLGVHFWANAGSSVALWALAAGNWIAVSLFLPMLGYRGVGAGGSKERSWSAAALTALTVSVWLQWDLVVADKVLSAIQLSIFAAAATLGKIPYHVTSVVSNVSINASKKGGKVVTTTVLLIIASGIVYMSGLALTSHVVLALFHLQTGIGVVIVYSCAAMLLGISYLASGLAGHNGYHAWWPMFLSLGAWTWVALYRDTSATTLAWELLAATALGLVGVVGMALRRIGIPIEHRRRTGP